MVQVQSQCHMSSNCENLVRAVVNAILAKISVFREQPCLEIRVGQV